MPLEEVPLGSWLAALRGEPSGEPWAEPGADRVLAVDLDAYDGTELLPALHAGWPVVVLGLTAQPEPERHAAAAVCDLALRVGDQAVDAVTGTVAEQPIASAAFAALLRGAEARPIDDGLVAESATYSTLQAGPEFAVWRGGRPVRARTDDGPPVTVRRDGD